MGAIRLKTEGLNPRRRTIARMLRPLHAGQLVACDITHDRSGSGTVLGAHDGRSASRDYRDWRFRSKAKGVWCQYFEIWSDAEPQSQHRLVCAYFKLSVIDPEKKTLEEFLCIHCDPDDPSDMKRGPHLHVTKADDPIPKCHFPLNYSHLDDVLESIHTLTKAMCNAIAIVATDVIPRFPAHA